MSGLANRGVTYVCFWVHLHLWRRIVVLHILLTNLSAILYDFDPLAQVVGRNGSSLDGSFRDESNGGLGDESLQKGSEKSLLLVYR